MKKLSNIVIMLLLLSAVSACGNNGTDDQEETVNETNEVTEDTNDVTEEMDDVNEDVNSTVSPEGNEDDEYIDSQLANLNFSEIAISISYSEDRDFEISIDRDDDSDRYEIEIEDELNNVFFRDREAFDHIYPKLETLDISTESEELDIVEQVLNAFDLPDDYEEFEIEIHFDDGSRIDFEHRK